MRRPRACAASVVVAALAMAGAHVVAQQPAPDFNPIFDGVSLKGWDGDPTFWRVEHGAIVGESTPERRVTQNTFIIWRGGEPGDFELKCEYGLTATNSGIQIRSVQLPPGPTSASG